METHTALGLDPNNSAEFPQNKSGNVKTGKFPYSWEDPDGVPSDKVHDVVFDPQIVRPRFGYLEPRDFARVVPVAPIDDVDPAGRP